MSRRDSVPSHLMDLDGPRESESTSMDLDDDSESCRHSRRCDSIKMDSPGPSDGQMSFDFHSQKRQAIDSVQTSIHSLPSHPPPGCERLSVSDASPRLMTLSLPPSPVNDLGEMGDVYQNHGHARQRRDALPKLKLSIQSTPRKRKRTHDSPHGHTAGFNDTQDDDTLADDTDSKSSRRTRPRLRKRQEEFTPLLFMSPSRERDSLAEEETISAFHYPPNVTDPSRSIQRHFYFGNSHEHGPHILQSSSSPKVNDPEDHKPEERVRSDSVNSFAEVALASTATSDSSRLSSLQGLSLPRPFEDTEQPSMGCIKVHERGIDALPSFPSTNSGRTGGPCASCESAGSPTDALGPATRASSRPTVSPLEPNSTNFLDKPRCDSPDPIDPDRDALTHIELPTVQVTRARPNFTPQGHGKQQ